MMNRESALQHAPKWFAHRHMGGQIPKPRYGTWSLAMKLGLTVVSLIVLVMWPPQSLIAAEVTDQNVDQMVASAKTPEDHQALATYFTAKAAQAGESAKMHEKMLNSLQGGNKPAAKELWNNHCQSLIRSFRSQQADYQALAKEQETIAKTLSGAHN